LRLPAIFRTQSLNWSFIGLAAAAIIGQTVYKEELFPDP